MESLHACYGGILGSSTNPDSDRVLREQLAHANQAQVREIGSPNVLGGGLALIGEPLRASVEATLPKFLMQVFAPGPRIAIAALGEEMVPIGAILLANDVTGQGS